MTELSLLNFSEGFFRTSGRNGDIFQVALYQLDMKLDQLKARTDGVGQQMGRSRLGYMQNHSGKTSPATGVTFRLVIKYMN